MERPTCATCPYWDWEADQMRGTIDDFTDAGDAKAECRRFPPTIPPTIRFLRNGKEFDKTIASYGQEGAAIETNQWDWCGEHPDFPAYVASLESTKKFDVPIEQLGLSIRRKTRTLNSLKNNGITTIRELIQQTPGDLLSFKNFGQLCLDEIVNRLAAMGLKLRDSS